MGIDTIMTRAVFLDRDGVINRVTVRDGKPYPPQTLDSLEVLAGVPEALLRLREAGFRLIVVTNQPDVARGVQTREMVEAMHEKLASELAVDEVLTCYHDGDACDCRKPKPGALLDAARRHGVVLDRSFMIGDRWRDIEAGQGAGCQCLFVDNGYRERQPVAPFVRVTSLAAAAEWILGNES
jgi:D-glycero-D-manno-heptose 1,7-bisphosphate phosphatase